MAPYGSPQWQVLTADFAKNTLTLAQFAATTSAQLAGIMSDETGTGLLVFATNPVLTTPNLGTPSAVTLTNGTGLPIASGVSGLGTGVATALAVNVGTAGAPVVNGGALGSPSSAGPIPSTGSVTAHSGTAIPAGGTAGAGLLVSSTANFGVFFGSGAPSLSAAKGSLYLRSDGTGTNDRMYVNTDAGTTWTAVVTVA